MKMLRPWCVVLALGLIPAVAWAAGGAGGGSGAGGPTFPFAGDCVVAVVKEVAPDKATYANPPRVKLQIVEVLRGDPKIDRTQAVWSPPPHGIDTRIITENPRYKQWAATPFPGPKVGEKFVLWGGGDGKVFVARERTPYTDDDRQKAIEIIERARKISEEYQKKAEAEKKARAEAVAKWRQGVSADDLRQYAAKADFVAVGRMSGEMIQPGPWLLDFKVTRILKGEKDPIHKYTDNSYYVTFHLPAKLAEMLDRDKDYLLFLQPSAKSFSASAPSYVTIPLGDGIVIADEEALKALGAPPAVKPAAEPAASRPAKTATSEKAKD
jgi:hypothetical protein